MTTEFGFTYESVEQLAADLTRRGLELPLSDDFSRLARPVAFGRLTVPNRLAVQPMEGCDGLADGSPGELTVRRYDRFAAGGAGMIWFEACAVAPEARASSGCTRATRRPSVRWSAARGRSPGGSAAIGR